MAHDKPPPARIFSIAALFVVALQGCASGPPPPVNVIVISLDTLRADRLGAYGYARVTSPRLDAFAERNIVFLNAHTQFTSTHYSHQALFTGRYPFRLGLAPSLAQLLKASGYRTAGFTGGGYVSREPRYVFDTLAASPFLEAVHHHQYRDDRRLQLTPEGLREMPQLLERLNVRYVLVHRTELPRVEWHRVTRWLERGPLRRVYQGSQLRAYEVTTWRPGAGRELNRHDHGDLGRSSPFLHARDTYRNLRGRGCGAEDAVRGSARAPLRVP